MSEFVQHHAQEQEQHKNHGTGRTKGDPADQQKKGDVNAQLNAGDANYRKRPAHE